MSAETKKPLDTIRDGALKATIWNNLGEKGPFYSVELSRTYRSEDGAYHVSSRFAGAELLRIARLAEIAYEEILAHQERDRREAYAE